MPRGTMCRHSTGECDLDEFCTGDSGECPADLFVKNGLSCADTSGEEGFCFNGDCPTRTDQCQELWGQGAEPAEDYCYQQYNMMGTANGNCGEFKNKYSKFGDGKEFKKCASRSVE